MNTLQRLFDRLVGIAHYEAALRDRARQVFDAPAINLVSLETPACWRRQARIRGPR